MHSSPFLRWQWHTKQKYLAEDADESDDHSSKGTCQVHMAAKGLQLHLVTFIASAAGTYDTGTSN